MTYREHERSSKASVASISMVHIVLIPIGQTA